MINMALLLALNLQVAAILVYAFREQRSAFRSRAANRQYQEDALVYDDLMARLAERGIVSGRPLVARRKRADDEQAAQDDAGDEVSDGSHLLMGNGRG